MAAASPATRALAGVAALIHPVAIGYPNLDHAGLDASGTWLLYPGGQVLYVSHDGATPHQAARGLVAAAWSQ